MAIQRKHLLGVAAITVLLFVVAAPLGDRHHGLGKHSHFVADLGQTLFVMSILGLVAFVLLALVAAVQLVRRRQTS